MTWYRPVAIASNRRNVAALTRAPVLFTRQVLLDAAVGIATVQQREVLRSALLNVTVGIATASTFWSIFERAAALDAALLTATIAKRVVVAKGTDLLVNGNFEDAGNFTFPYVYAEYTGGANPDPYVTRVADADGGWVAEVGAGNNAADAHPALKVGHPHVGYVQTGPGTVKVTWKIKAARANQEYLFNFYTFDALDNTAVELSQGALIVETLSPSNGWVSREGSFICPPGTVKFNLAIRAIGQALAGAMLYVNDVTAAPSASRTTAVVAPETSALFFTTFARAAALDAAVAVATTGEIIPGLEVFERAAAFNASVGLTTAPQRELLRAAAINLTMGVATAQQRDLLRAASVNATLEMASAATFFSILERAVAVTATTGVSTVPQRDLLRAAALGAAVALETQGFRIGAEFERSASMNAAVGISTSAEFYRLVERAAAFTASVNVSAIPQRELLRAASLAIGVDVSSTAMKELSRAVALGVALGIAAQGTASDSDIPLEQRVIVLQTLILRWISDDEMLAGAYVDPEERWKTG